MPFGMETLLNFENLPHRGPPYSAKFLGTFNMDRRVSLKWAKDDIYSGIVIIYTVAQIQQHQLLSQN